MHSNIYYLVVLLSLIFSGDCIQISKKTLIRGQNYNSRNAVSYALLDTDKQSAFMSSFDKSGYKSSDKLLIAYKPRRGRFAVYDEDEVTLEEAERFVGSVFNGDVQLSPTKQVCP